MENSAERQSPEREWAGLGVNIKLMYASIIPETEESLLMALFG
jgi:hypothetical protein